MWNRSGNRPVACDVLERVARALDPPQFGVQGSGFRFCGFRGERGLGFLGFLGFFRLFSFPPVPPLALPRAPRFRVQCN